MIIQTVSVPISRHRHQQSLHPIQLDTQQGNPFQHGTLQERQQITMQRPVYPRQANPAQKSNLPQQLQVPQLQNIITYPSGIPVDMKHQMVPLHMSITQEQQIHCPLLNRATHVHNSHSKHMQQQELLLPQVHDHNHPIDSQPIRTVQHFIPTHPEVSTPSPTPNGHTFQHHVTTNTYIPAVTTHTSPTAVPKPRADFSSLGNSGVDSIQVITPDAKAAPYPQAR